MSDPRAADAAERPSSSQTTEELALLAAAQAGDAAALGALLSAHQARIHRFARSLCRDGEDAAEVLQDTLLAAARGIGGFRGEASLATWLFTIARSACLKRRRRGVAEPAALESLDAEAEGPLARLAAPDPGPDEQLDEHRLVTALEAAIAALEPAQREVLVLRDVEGLTAPEVGAVLGLEVGAVKSRLHRARVAVRERLAPLVQAAARGKGPSPVAAGRAGPPRPMPESSVAAACPDVAALLSRHLEGDIDAATCAEMERHVEGCARCQATCDSLRETLALCRAAPAPALPPEVEARVRAALRGVLEGLHG